MRALIVSSLLLLPALTRADDPPLLSLQVRVSGGITLAESSNGTMKLSPIGLGFGAEGAIIAEPWTSVYGRAFFEGGETIDAGVAGGLRFRPSESRLRFGLGGVALFSPASEFGVEAAMGVCGKAWATRLCLDGQGMIFIGGDGLAPGTVDARVGLALELNLDVL